MPADTLDVPVRGRAVKIQPHAVVHRVHPNASGAPQELRGTRVMIPARTSIADGRHGQRHRCGAPRLFSRHAGAASRLRATSGCRDIVPKPSPDLAESLALPGRCLPVSIDRNQQRLVASARRLTDPRRFARTHNSQPAPPVGHGVRTRNRAMRACLRLYLPQAVGQTRAGRGAGTHRRDLRQPQRPKVSVLANSRTICMVNSPIRFMALSSSACAGSPLRCLREAS